MAEALGGAHLVGECVALGGGELVTHHAAPNASASASCLGREATVARGGWKGVRERRSGVDVTFQSSGY